MSQQPVPGTCAKVGPACRFSPASGRAGRADIRDKQNAGPTLAVERAAPGFPIWPCTRWGFPCLVACASSGALLPHLFTLTGASCEAPAVCSLWHCPSARLSAWPPAYIQQPAFLRWPRRLRGIAPYGVRTFLLPRIAPEKAILRPSKIKGNIRPRRANDKGVIGAIAPG